MKNLLELKDIKFNILLILLIFSLINIYVNEISYTLTLIIFFNIYIVISLIISIEKFIKGNIGFIGLSILQICMIFYFLLDVLILGFSEIQFQVIPGYYPYLVFNEYPLELVNYGLLILLLFYISYIIGLSIRLDSSKMLFVTRTSRFKKSYELYLLISLSLFSYIYLIYKNGLHSLSHLIGLMRINEENNIIILHYGVGNLIFIISVVACIYLVINYLIENKNILIKLVCFLIALMQLYLITGTTAARYIIGMVFFIPILYLIIKNKFLNIKINYIYLLFLVLFILFIFLILIQVRNSGLDQITNIAIFDNILINIYSGIGHFGVMLNCIDFIQNKGDFFYELNSKFFLFHLIPREIWSSKPTPQSWIELNALITNNQWNITPSILGQYYMNWGISGIICIGLFFGLLSNLINLLLLNALKLKNYYFLVFLCSIFYFIIISFRYLSPIYLMYSFILFFLYLFLTKKYKLN
jgi:oligosaccharide repeat unit polymerase